MQSENYCPDNGVIFLLMIRHIDITCLTIRQSGDMYVFCHCNTLKLQVELYSPATYTVVHTELCTGLCPLYVFYSPQLILWHNRLPSGTSS